ncbi:MAG TPA: SusE domain-containing protein [Flavisolibacter sp.]|nr:SusE domain-containing protein [Flavisolibacter sp.]
MKNKWLVLTAFFLVVIASCKKDENRVYLEGGTAPVLSASVSSTIPLSFVNKDAQAIKLNWTNPEYQFTTGPSSQNVNYQLEIDTAGANFTNPARQTISISSDLSKSFTQAELNDILLNQLVLIPGMQHTIEMRVKSYMGTTAAMLPSNVLKFTVTPYAIPPKVDPPASGTLYVTGAATPANWQCGCGEPENLAQKFVKKSNTLYELPSIALKGGQSYLIIPVYGSWAAKYGGVGGNNSNNVDGDDFKANGSDLLSPPADGNYKITVDFQRGKFTVTKL